MHKSKILVIGHGHSVLTSERGKEIDAFPGAIVRLNHYKIEGYEKHIGTRVDIYCSGGRFHMGNAKKDYIIVLVYMSGICPDYFNKFKAANDKNIVIAIPKEEVYALKKDLNNSELAFATTGIAAVYSFMIRNFDVYIYGFDFYRDNKMEYYTDEIKKYLCVCHEPVKENAYIDRLLEDNKIKIF